MGILRLWQASAKLGQSSASINTTVVDVAQPVEIAYGVTGTNAERAIVAVAEAEGSYMEVPT